MEKFRTRKVKLLLAILSSKPGKEWGREVLGEICWPDTDMARQRVRLKYELSQLRVVLGAEAIPGGKHDSVFADASRLSSDVADFDRAVREAFRVQTPNRRLDLLRGAVALYGGDLLPGVFDDWACAERERLRESLFRAQTALVLDLESLGRTGEAHDVRRALETQFPERELPKSPEASPDLRMPPPAPAVEETYFGREAERAAVEAWIDSDDRCVLTLLGPGGIGKSRLAREVAVGGRGGIWISLAEVVKPERVLDSLLASLSVSGAESDPFSALVTGLERLERPLLVLDNVEQIANGVGPLLARLLDAVPKTKFLVTSRRILGIPNEMVLTVDPLPAHLSAALFLNRARRIRSDFAHDSGSSELVEAIVRLLEGLPLAIELAAARTVVLGPRQILAQLQNRLPFLVNRRSTSVERHASIRTAIDWSYQLLSETQQCAVRRLSVFRGGFSLEAAEAVLGSAVDTLDDLDAHSLLSVQLDEEGEARYDFHPLIREFAEERCAEAAESSSAGEAHVAFFLDEAARLKEERESPVRRARLERDLENYRQAIRLAAQSGDGSALYSFLDRLGGALFYFGYWRDADDLLDRVERFPVVSQEHRRLCGLRGAFARTRGDDETARRYWTTWLERAREAGDTADERDALFHLAVQSLESGDGSHSEYIEAYATLADVAIHFDSASLLRAWEAKCAGRTSDAIARLLTLKNEVLAETDAQCSLMLFVTQLLSELGQYAAIADFAPSLLRSLVVARHEVYVGVFAGFLADAYRALGKGSQAVELYYVSWSVLEPRDSRHREPARRKWEASLAENCPEWGQNSPPWRDMLTECLEQETKSKIGK